MHNCITEPSLLFLDIYFTLNLMSIDKKIQKCGKLNV